MDVFWDGAPRSMVDCDVRLWGSYCLHHQGEAVRSYELETLHKQFSAAKQLTYVPSLNPLTGN